MCSDEEYIEARRKLRDKSDKGLCDDVFNSVGHECEISDYEKSDGDIYSSETDEDDDIRLRKKIRRVVYDPKTEPKALKLEIGMRFDDGFQAREVIRANATEDGRAIHFKRVSKVHMQARCTEPCKWKCYGSLETITGHFKIKILNLPHTCSLAVRNKQVTSTWIARQYLNVFRYRPEITVKELAAYIMLRYNCHVTRWKLYNARTRPFTC